MRSFRMNVAGSKRLLQTLSAFCLLATTLTWFSAPPAQGQVLPQVSVSDAVVTEINGTPGVAYKNVLVTFSVTGTRTGAVSVVYDTVDTGSATSDLDYRNFSQAVSIPAGRTSVTRAIRVYGDTEPEPTETFEVRISNPVDATIADDTGVITINDNDGYVPPSGPTISIADASVTEGDGPGTVTLNLSLSEASATPVTVVANTADGSATDVNDYSAFSGTLTFPANQTSISQVINIVGDTVFEPTETFTVSLSNPSSNATIADGSATVTINDNDPEPPGTPDLSVSDETVGEGDGSVTVTVTADETSTSPVTFDLSTGGGDATPGSDYTAISGTSVTLPAGSLSVTQTISILEDTTSESPETFNVTISNVVGGTIVDGTGQVTITDNDAPACSDGPYVTVGDITVTESDGQKNVLVTFTRSFTTPTNMSTRFYARTVDGTATAADDYIAKAAQLVVINGTNTLTKTLAFKILGDTAAEPVEEYTIELFNPLRACIDPNNDSGTITIIDNDGPPTPSVSVSNVSTTETDGPSSVNVSVALSAASATPVTVELSTGAGSATAGSDYVAVAANTVTIPAGSLTAVAPIDIIGDTVFEPTETFQVSLANPSGALLGTSTATVTILDNDPAPPAISVADASTTETDGSSTVDVTVSVDQQSASATTVLLTTADGTATAGADYVAVNQQLVTIPANTSSVVVPLSIVGDDDYEPTEAFTVSLSSPSANAILGDNAATITILDDEDPPPVMPNISVADVTTTETDAASSVDVTVSLSEPTSNTVSVSLATADGSATDGSDYTATGPVTVTFAPGDVAETVTIPILGDTVSESSETFTVSLSSPTNGVITDGTATVTIDDNDAPACTSDPLITIDDLTVTETEFEINALVTFRRSYSTNSSTRFYVDTVDGTAVAPGDYTARSNQLIVIQSGKTVKTLAFKIQGDSIAELPETFEIRAFNPTRGCIDPNNDTGTVTINDNDGPPTPSVSVANATTTETDATSSVDVTVSLSAASLSAVTVELSTADGTATSGADYVAVAGQTVTIPAGQTSVTAPISIVGDTVFESTETFQVNLANPSGALLGANASADVTINDNDPAPPAISVADASTTETDGSSTVDVTVSVDQQSASAITVDLSTADGTATAGADYVAVSQQSVTIPANTSSVVVPLSIVGDDIYEQSEAFTVSLTGPSANAIIGDGSATVTILDDEDPPPVIPDVSVADVTTTETDAASSVDVTVSLSEPTSNTVSVSLATADGSATDGSDYTATGPVTVTFAPGDVAETVTIPILGDTVSESSETFTVSLSGATNGAITDGTATVTIDDNDAPACTSDPLITIDDLTVTETEFEINALVTFRRSYSVNTSTRFYVDTVDGTAVAPGDYTARSSQLIVIQSGKTVKTLAFKIKGDSVGELTESFEIRAFNPTRGCIDPNNDSGTITILDNDLAVPNVSVANVTTTETDTTSSVGVTVSLDAVTPNPVSVQLTTANGTATAPDDYINPGVVSVDIPAGQLSATVPIGIVGDNDYEPTETFTVNLSNPTSANIGTGTATVTINDDEPLPPEVSVASASTTETDANSTVDVTVSLASQTDKVVTVLLSTSNGTATAGDDYVAVAGQLVTIPANTSSVTVPLTIVGDDVYEQTETFTVSISAPTNALPGTMSASVTINDDEVPPPTVSVADATTTETDGASTVDVAVSLNTTSTNEVTVLLSTSDGTAVAGSDYVAAVNEVVTIPANTLSVNASIGIIGDDVYEQSETFSVFISSPSNAVLGDNTATVGITDDEPPPPGLSIADITTAETDSNFTVDATISLDSASTSAITVELSTTDGTATAPGDYVAISDQVVTIPAGSLSVTVPVTIVGDTLYEQTEEFTLTLANAANALIGDGIASVTVSDTDPFVPTISVADASVTETDAATSVDVTVSLSDPSTGTISVDLATADGTATAGTDYVATGPTTVTFNPGQTSQTVTIGIIGDTVTEPVSEIFAVNLSNPVGGVIGDGSADIAITDDDGSLVCGSVPQIIVDDFSIVEGDAFTKNAAVTFRIPFLEPNGQSVRFYVSTENGTATAPSDFTARSNQLLVIAGGTLSKELQFVIKGDTLEEGDESFNVRIANPTRGCIDPADDFGVVTILGDDGPPKPQISIADVSTTETDAASTVDVTLSTDITAVDPITVQLDTVDGTAVSGTDYVAATAQTVTIPAGQTSATFSLNIVGDTDFELEEEFQVALSSPSSNAEIADGTATVTITDNDPSTDPVLTIGDVDVTEGDANVTAQVTVTSSLVSATPITVDLDTTSGTAVAGADFNALTGVTLTIPAGQLTASETITIIGDELDEGTEAFTVTMSNPSAPAIIIGSPTATVTITDDDGFIAVNPQLRILDVSVVESNGVAPGSTKNVALTFELVAGNYKPAGQASFMWETIPTGSASQGDTATDDYPYSRSVDPGNPTIDLPVTMPMPEPNGATVVRTRTMKVYGDTLPESDETFEVHLFNVTTSLSDPSVIDVVDGVGVVTIEDNDGPPEISIDDVTVNEGETATLTLSLDRVIPQQIDVQVDTADGTAIAPGDYTAVTAQVVSFPANTQTVTVDIPVIDDGDFEGATEEFTVNLTNPVNAAIVDAQGVVTITDADGPPLISIADVSAVETDDTFKSVLLNITLDKAAADDVTMRFGTVNGTAIGGTALPSDFQRVNGSATSGPLLTFLPGEVTKTISVKIFGDTEDENDEQFTVQLYAPTNATFLNDFATVTIIDNDTLAGISIADLTVLEGDGSTAADFVLADATLSMDIPVIDPVTVQVDSADGTAVAGTDYEAITAQTVTFPANATTATIQVKVFNNDVLDGNRDFVLNLSNQTANAGIADAQATITIDDNDDLPKVSVSDLTVTEGDGSAPADFVNADVTVSLDSPAAAAVTVDFDTSDGTATAGTDYEAVAAQTLTIPAGATSVTQAVKVYGDAAVEADETFTVTLSNQSANVDPGTMTATVTIEDNEVIPDVSIAAAATVTEGNTGFGFGVLQVSLSEASNLPVSIDVTTTDGTATGGVDYEVISGQTVTIPAGATTASPPIFVKVFGDVDVESTENLTVTISNAVNGNIVAATGTVTIEDNDAFPLISIADVTITEGDAGNSTLDLTLTTDIPVAQTVTVELTTADGTATAGVDYLALNGAVATFNTGEDTTTVGVSIVGDLDFESNEDFTITLANPVNALIDDGTATATIVENDIDPSLPSLRVEDIFVTEGDTNQSNVELVFVLEQASENTIRATATMQDITATSGAAAGDGDYVPIIDLPLVFQPGERILKRVIKINGDEDYEGNETARILLTPNTTATTADDVNIIDPEGILTILDSEVGPGDGPQLFVANVTQQEGGNVGFRNMEVTFMLDEPSGAPVFFDVAALDGNTGINDATLAGGDFVDPATHLVMPIRIPPGEQILKRNFRINGDTLLEGNEVFRLAVQNVLGAVPGGNGEGTMTILDTDLPVGTPTVNVMDIIDGENGDVGTENATIKFFLDRPHDTTVTVQYQPIDGTLTAANGDYNPNVASPTVTFEPGEQIAEKPVVINRDSDYTGVQYLDVVISNPTGGAVLGDSTGRVTIYDDEQQANLPGIHFTTTDIEEADAGFTIANLKAYIDKPFSGVVEATFQFLDGTAKQGIDYDFHKNANNANITTIRFSNGEQVAETKARALSDPYFEGNEVFQMELISVTGDAQIVDAIGDIHILDDDKDGDPLEPTFNDADIAVSVSADKASANGGETVVYTVDVTNNGPDDGNLVESTFTVPTGLTFVSLDGCAGSVTATTTCAIGSLANGATSSYTVSVTVDLTTSGVVTATATASTQDIDSPISNNTDTANFTAISPYENDVVYISLANNGTVGGVSYNQADILAYDRGTGQWSLFFDGSDVGLITLDGFNIVDFTPGATIIDLSMTSTRNISPLGSVDDADVIRFTGTTGTATSGAFTWIIDASDLGLSAAAENIDAVAGVGVDNYVISTTGNLSGNGFTAKEQDLVLFDPTAIGDPTSGTFSMFLDGSTIAMTTAAEDISAAWVDPAGDIFLSTAGNLVANNGFISDLDDIVILTNPATGTFLPYFDGDTMGLTNRNIDGLHIERG